MTVKKTNSSEEGNKDDNVPTEEDNEPDFEMEVGESFKLAVKKISSKKLISSDKSIVIITKKGKVKAIAPGSATITIKDKKTKKVVAEYVVSVVSPVDPDFEIKIGETMRIAMKSGYTIKSSNEKIVSVSAKGKIKGIKKGLATIVVYDKKDVEYEKYIVQVIE